MKLLRSLIFSLFFITTAVYADTYPEVIFDNSLIKGSYAKSRVVYSGKSWVENVNKHLLVSDTLFFTPGNALSLKYLSSDEGQWKSEIRYSRQKFNYRVADTDLLSFRLYIKTPETQAKDLPRIYINQWSTLADTLAISKYIKKIEYGKWLHILIPSKDFRSLNNQAAISSIGFVQNESSFYQHHLFLDQIEFLPKTFSTVKLTSPALLADVIAYDKMVHLRWQLPLTPSIRYVKIYRSLDGKSFSPIAIKPIHMQSCLDVIPNIGRKYFYKIAWVDYNYEESPSSAAKEAQTKELSNTQLLDLIQLAHVNYFVENYDINSGMYLPYRSKDKAVVSTQETAGAILALIIGAERKHISRQAVLNRVSRITYFLQKAQHNHGVLPAYFDGRKAIPEYLKGTANYDVAATSALIEALLVAKQYFSLDNETENDLRKRIDMLYQRIEWPYLTFDGTNVLHANISMADSASTNHKRTISGPNSAIGTYLLALSSTKHPLPDSTYYEAVYNNYQYLRYHEPSEDLDFQADTLDFTSNSGVLPAQVNVLDSMSKVSILDPQYQYGTNLPLGKYEKSLMNLYKPFLTIKPQAIQDSLLNWDNVLKTYVSYIKRRDNELGVGTTNSDIWGFYQHQDSIDNFRINPAISASAISVEPEFGIASILALYDQYGQTLFTEYGFRAWIDLRDEDVSDEYLAQNQAAIAIAVENYRSGLIWDLYQQIPEINTTITRLFADQK